MKALPGTTARETAARETAARETAARETATRETGSEFKHGRMEGRKYLSCSAVS